MYTYIYTYIHTYMYTTVVLYIDKPTCTHTRICTMYTYIHVHNCSNVHRQTYMYTQHTFMYNLYIHKHIYMPYIHIARYTSIHTYTNTYTCRTYLIYIQFSVRSNCSIAFDAFSVTKIALSTSFSYPRIDSSSVSIPCI